MPDRISRSSFQQLMAYSAAAGLGAYAVTPNAQALVFVQDLNLDLEWSVAANPNPPNGAAGDDFNYINWDAGLSFDLQTSANPNGYDHFINAGKFGVQVSPWCDSANYPGCRGDTPGFAGVSSFVFSSQSVLDPDNAANLDPSDPFYTTEWANNTYYVVGFGPEVTIDGTQKTVGVINYDYYTGFLTMLGSFGVGDNDASTHVVQGGFVAFSFEGTDGTHYGWVQVGRQTGPSTFTTAKFHSYAIETEPDTPISTPIVGDLNFDGFVGLDDLDIVLTHWNQNVDHGDWMSGDIAGFIQPDNSGRASGMSGGDGFVGLDDLDAVLNNWNTGTPPTSNALVPEPASLILLAGGYGALGLRRRRSN